MLTNISYLPSSILPTTLKLIQSDHTKVLSLFLDKLEQKLSELEIEAKNCSYRAALWLYVDAKIGVHRCNKLNSSVILDARSHRFYTYKNRVEELRETMYSNVCMKCDACKSRRKKWPDWTNMKIGNEHD